MKENRLLSSEVSEAEKDAMRKLVDMALQAKEESGKSGIAAALLANGEMVGSGANHVHLENNPTRHAEIVAIDEACDHLGRTDLSDCVLLSTLQPCEMCLSAARFSGIRRIVFAARQGNVAKKYFAFSHLNIEDFLTGNVDLEALGGVLEEEVLDLYVDGQE